jgi:hypothetical protein
VKEVTLRRKRSKDEGICSEKLFDLGDPVPFYFFLIHLPPPLPNVTERRCLATTTRVMSGLSGKLCSGEREGRGRGGGGGIEGERNCTIGSNVGRRKGVAMAMAITTTTFITATATAINITAYC